MTAKSGSEKYLDKHQQSTSTSSNNHLYKFGAPIAKRDAIDLSTLNNTLSKVSFFLAIK